VDDDDRRGDAALRSADGAAEPDDVQRPRRVRGYLTVDIMAARDDFGAASGYQS
jgi:hypothetical protein